MDKAKQIASAMVVCCLLMSSAYGQEKKLEPLNVAYSSVTPTHAPLWIAKEMGIFERYGLDVKTTNISAGAAIVSSLIAGEMQIISDAGASIVAGASRGAPLVIVASSGPIPYKLIAHPSINSIEGLKGKVIGSSRPGAGSDFVLRRLLPKLGLVPGKDVTLLATGLSRSDERLLVMLQGKIDATIGTTDNVTQLELKGLKVNVLADFREMGVYTTGGEYAVTRQFLKDNRPRLKAFLTAFSEGIWIGRTNKEAAFKVWRKYIKADDPKVLESMHRNYLLGTIPLKPFPLADAVQTNIDEVTMTQPELKVKRPAEFMDDTILRELEGEGFFQRLHR